MNPQAGNSAEGSAVPAGISAPALLQSDPPLAAAVAEPVAPALPWRAALREWIEEHDHRWLFVVVYLGLAVLLSVFVSLFWLVVMAGLHLLLECIRHRRPGWSGGRILSHAAWEVKLDFALVLLALGVVLYVDVVIGILGIQSAARAAAVTRAGARVATRLAAWERNLRAFLVTVDEMVRVVRAFFLLLRRRGRGAPLPVPAAPSLSPWQDRWGLGDRIAIGISIACLLLILVAPLLTGHSWESVAATLLEELQPLPG